MTPLVYANFLCLCSASFHHKAGRALNDYSVDLIILSKFIDFLCHERHLHAILISLPFEKLKQGFVGKISQVLFQYILLYRNGEMSIKSILKSKDNCPVPIGLSPRPLPQIRTNYRWRHRDEENMTWKAARRRTLGTRQERNLKTWFTRVKIHQRCDKGNQTMSFKAFPKFLLTIFSLEHVSWAFLNLLLGFFSIQKLTLQSFTPQWTRTWTAHCYLRDLVTTAHCYLRNLVTRSCLC